MINRLIASTSLRPVLRRAVKKVVQKTVQPTAAISSSRGRPFSSTGFEETANGNARSLDDYEQIMGPAPAMSWIEEAVHATAASGVCSLTGWSSSPLTLAETTSTTMGLENVFQDDDNLAATAGYRTQCSFESDAEDNDCTRPGVDSPANEV